MNTFEESGAKKMGFVDGNLKPSKLAEHFTISDVRANQIKRPVNSEYFRGKWS